MEDRLARAAAFNDICCYVMSPTIQRLVCLSGA